MYFYLLFQGQLKKRKLDSGEACSGGKASSTAVSKKRRSAGEELEEESESCSIAGNLGSMT